MKTQRTMRGTVIKETTQGTVRDTTRGREGGTMLRVQIVNGAAELEAFRGAWEELLERSSMNEPTLSPDWLLAWWRVFGPLDGRALRAVLLWDGPRLAGLAPFCERPRRHRLGIPLRALELVCSGEDEADEICSDYLGVIAERGAEPAVARGVAEALSSGELGGWDELTMPAMRGDHLMPVLLASALEERGAEARVEVTGASPHIPLPATWDDYLAALPSSRRYMVRRSIRDMEAWAKGTLRLERAERREDLARGMEILVNLHGARWSADGQSGVFASPRFRAFHEEVMPALLDRGALELWWLTAHGEPVAAVYNVVWKDKVYFYQGGRKPDLPPNVRAGIVMHAYAIRESIAAGRREYDFLAGTSRYKMELSLASRPLVTLRATRPSLADAARRVADLALHQARVLRRALGSHLPGLTEAPPAGGAAPASEDEAQRPRRAAIA